MPFTVYQTLEGGSPGIQREKGPSKNTKQMTENHRGIITQNPYRAYNINGLEGTGQILNFIGVFSWYKEMTNVFALK